MIKFTKKKKIILFIIFIFLVGFIYTFSVVSEIVRHGYDKQNKVILFVKSVISPHYIKKIRDNLFIVSNLKSRNEFLELQVKKYEQGNEGKKFDSKIIKFNEQEYESDFFFLPFKRLDTNMGWNAEENSLRAHYLEIYDGNVFAISGEGRTIYFDKKNLLTNSLQFEDLPNNIEEILKENKF